MAKIPASLQGLAAEARKCNSWEEFERDFIHEIKHGTYWHVTDNPNFTIDLTKGPRDMSSFADGASDAGKLMITSHLDNWADHYGESRPYAALIDMNEVPREAYYQVNRGFGNEFFVSDPSKAKVVKVMPMAAAKALDRHIHNRLPGNEKDLKSFYMSVKNISKLSSPLFRDWNKTAGIYTVEDLDRWDSKLTRELMVMHDRIHLDPVRGVIPDYRDERNGIQVYRFTYNAVANQLLPAVAGAINQVPAAVKPKIKKYLDSAIRCLSLARNAASGHMMDEAGYQVENAFSTLHNAIEVIREATRKRPIQKTVINPARGLADLT